MKIAITITLDVDTVRGPNIAFSALKPRLVGIFTGYCLRLSERYFEFVTGGDISSVNIAIESCTAVAEDTDQEKN